MKRLVVIWLLSIAVLIGIAGCKSSEAPAEFADKTWTRDTETCIETLKFRSDGSCSYFCACGNPVNDDDLCEGYRYDAGSKIIYLDFLETTEETVTQIKVESYDDQTLVLDFDGDLRTFYLEEEA